MVETIAGTLHCCIAEIPATVSISGQDTAGTVLFSSETAEINVLLYGAAFEPLVQKLVDDSHSTIIPLKVDNVVVLRRQLEALLDYDSSHHIVPETEAVLRKVFSLISHDIRSPFSSTIGVMQLLLTDYDTMDDASRKDFLQTLLDAALQELEILEEISQWGRSMDEKLIPAPREIPIDALADSLCSVMLPKARSKEITFRSSLPAKCIVKADIELVSIALMCCLSNAVKYCPAGKIVELSAMGCDAPGNICLRITNDVANPVAEILEYVGNTFCSQPGTAGERGSGIGLHTARNLVRKMGGDITFKVISDYKIAVDICLPRVL